MKLSTAPTCYFTIIEDCLLACKTCKHAVWPHEVDRHLRGSNHRLDKQGRDEVIAAIHDLPLEDTNQFQPPAWRDSPYSELMLYNDGLMCKKDHCGYVCRKVETIRKHWRSVHQWSISGQSARTGLTREQKKAAQRRFDQSVERVFCQRFFPSQNHSQYFRVGAPEPASQLPATEESLFSQMCKRARERMELSQATEEDRVQEGSKDEANPWLRRTGWLKYLKGFSREQLLSYVAKPEDTEDESESVEQVIWRTVEEVGSICQATVSRCSPSIRMEAVRTEKHQTQHKPLETYWDPDAIHRRTDPWKKMLMFFVRTQLQIDAEARPPKYEFTSKQEQTFRTMLDLATAERERREAEEADESRQDDPDEYQKLSPLQATCLEFCIALLNDIMKSNDYEMPLVCALAVLGIDEHGWRQPDSYPPILSSVIKSARFMVVQKAMIQAGIQDDETRRQCAIDFDDNRQQRRHPVRLTTLVDWLNRIMDSFMVAGSHSPMQWMLSLRTYGLKIHNSTTTKGTVEWCNRDELLYKSAQFTMSQFRGMIHGMANEAKKIMMEELLFCEDPEDMPRVPWTTIRDDPSNEVPGWNFLKDLRTRLPFRGEDWLQQRIESRPELRRKFERPDSASGIDRSGVEAYAAAVDRVRELLLVAMHISGGQPARGTELLSIKHSNTATSHRNIFVEDGLIVFVTEYHKGYAISGSTKIIHRYLPREIGELFVWYLWLVLPFYSMTQTAIDKSYVEPAHLWPAEGNGVRWSSDKMRRVLKRKTEIGLGHALTIRDYRDIAIAISRRFMRGRTAFNDDEEHKDDEFDACDEQAGHIARIAGAIYARGISEMAGSVFNKRGQFREASVDWHRFLGFKETAESSKRRCPFDDEVDEGRIERHARMKRVNVDSVMKSMYGRDAEFRGIQKAVIEAIMGGKSPIIAVMPTGGGKSLLFMLPAVAEPSGVTIVVVPLIALKADLKRRCEEMGIRVAEWNARMPPDAATVVLVTPESALSVAFMTYVNRLRSLKQLDRIVIDECHHILHNDDQFRPLLREQGQLASAEVQMVLLTATLPPTKEAELRRRMGWEEGEVVLFRAATIRKNIEYSVVRPQTGGFTQAIHDRLVTSIADSEPGKSVIYCRSKARVKRLVESGLVKRCAGFHGDLNTTQRAQLLEEFRSGEMNVLITTNAFGEGVDIPDIRLVVHADEPGSMMNYWQESGRAGRDGARSRAVAIRCYPGSADSMVQQYLTSQVCRRTLPSVYMDGIEGRRCGEEEAMCDVCKAEDITKEVYTECIRGQQRQTSGEMGLGVNSQTEPGGSSDIKGVREEDRMEYSRQVGQQQRLRLQRVRLAQNKGLIGERLGRVLEFWKERCIACKGSGDSDHDIMRCSYAQGLGIHKAVEEMDSAMEYRMYENGSCCFNCGVPRLLCNGWREIAEDEGRFFETERDCQFSEVLFQIFIGVREGHTDVWGQWIRRIAERKVKISGDEGLFRWLGRRVRIMGDEGTNLMIEVIWMIDKVQEKVDRVDG